ncbi:MAG: hypothetical protein K6F84_01610 [Lachnospiraceae bacterium]|nr:hypothetical protein [Lachnospiraceae bacterium]
MKSQILQLIDEIEDFVNDGKPGFFQKDFVTLDRIKLDDLLTRLRQVTPAEIKQYQKIIAQREEILAEARAKAQQLIDDATAQTNALLDEHEIVQQAYDEANKVVQVASIKAKDVITRATGDANYLRSAANDYMDAQLGSIEETLTQAIDSATTHYEALLEVLMNYKNVVQANRAEIEPVDYSEESEGDGSETQGESDEEE